MCGYLPLNTGRMSHTNTHIQSLKYTHTHTHIYIYIYILLGEMVDFGKSDKIRKISGKVDKPNIDKEFSNEISSSFSKDYLRRSF